MIKKAIRYIEDCILAVIQGRCEHAGQMVAADVLEGCVSDLELKYCRRCGAIRPDWCGRRSDWRAPDPHLWRG